MEDLTNKVTVTVTLRCEKVSHDNIQGKAFHIEGTTKANAQVLNASGVFIKKQRGTIAEVE